MLKLQKRCCSKMGYSLVEVSLALLVAAIGLMTVFALFPDGLTLSRRSVDATEIAAFADSVFASLDNASASCADTASWNAFQNGRTNLPLTHMFVGVSNTPPTQPSIAPGGSTNPMVYYWIPKDAYGEGDSAGIVKYQIATFTYTLDIRRTGVVSRFARLEVWPGDVSNLVRVALTTNGQFEGSTVFYREFVPRE
jgi:hypothetical protein